MAPVPLYHEAINLYRRLVTKPTNASELILEAWGQGFMVGALIIMMCITLANMRKGVLLHKLILLEVRSLSHLSCTDTSCPLPKSHSDTLSTSCSSAYGTASGYSLTLQSMRGGCQSALSLSTPPGLYTTLSPG